MGKDYYLSSRSQGKALFFAPFRMGSPPFFWKARKTFAVPSVIEMTREALAIKIGSPPLREMVSGGKQVAVIVKKGTRLTPASEILTVRLPLSSTLAARKSILRS